MQTGYSIACFISGGSFDQLGTACIKFLSLLPLFLILIVKIYMSFALLKNPNEDFHIDGHAVSR